VKRISSVAALGLACVLVCSTATVLLSLGSTVSAGPTTSGTWSIVTTPDPSPTQSNQFSSVSCVSASFCMAVGSYAGASNQSGLVSEWNGTAWTLLTAPTPSADPDNPNSTVDNVLDSVSCTSTTFCAAVGDQSGDGEPLAEEWNGSSWSIVATPDVPGSGSSPSQPVSPTQPPAPLSPTPNVAPQVTTPKASLKSQGLNAVSCTGPTSCMAVGASATGKGDQTLAEQWNGSAWSLVATPVPAPASPQVLEGISCSGGAFCVAVGLAQSPVTGASQPLIEQWNGSSWSLMASATADPGGELLGISCVGSSFCMADGYVKGGSAIQDLSEQWNGSTWSVVATPEAVTAVGGGLAGLSCVGPSLCVASGVDLTTMDNSSGTTQVLLWNGQTWAPEQSPTTGASGDLTLLYGVSCVARQACMSVGSDADNNAGTSVTLAVWAPLLSPGYYTASAAGGVFAMGGSQFFGSAGGLRLAAPIVGMATTPDGGGYWLVASDGGVFAFGDATFYGSTGGLVLNKPIVGMAATPDGLGYWLVASDGGIFAFGDATFYGSTGSLTLNKPVVGMATTPDGGGYWLVASDGGVFNFGDATFYGSTGSLTLSKPIVGMAATPDGRGYWLVGADGGIFNAGDAGFYGSAVGVTLAAPIVGMVPTSDGMGYWLVGADGGIFNAGDAAFGGSSRGMSPGIPIVGVAT